MPTQFTLDPVQLYLKFPRMIDFLLFWLLFSFFVKKSLVTGRELRKETFGKAFRSAFTGEKEEKLDGPIAAIVGLILSLAIMVYGKFSLESMFTSGLFPAVMGLVVGIIAYSSLRPRFSEENWFMSIVFSVFIGGIVFAILTYKRGAQQQNWTDIVFWIAALLIVWMVISRKPAKESADKSLGRATSDLNTASKDVERLERELADAKKKADDAAKKHKDLDKAARGAESAAARSRASSAKASATQKIFATALGAALAMMPASFDQIKSKLKENNYPPAIVNLVVDTLKATKGAPPAAPSATPTAAPAVQTPAAVTAVEDAQVTSEETAVVIKKIDDYMKSIADIPNRIDSAFTVYTDVNKKIDSAEKDIRDTTRVVEKDLKRAQKLGDTALETSAVGLNEELSRLDSDIVQEKGILGRIEDTLPLLRADSSQIRRFSTELGQFLPKLRQLNENLNTAIKSNNWQFCTQLSLEAEQLFASVAQFTGTHAGTNETLSQAIQSALDALEKSKTAIEKISGYVAEVKSKSQKLETDITAKEKGAVTEAAGVAGVIEAGNKLIPLVQQIERSNLTEKTAEEENNAFGALCLRVFNDANTLSTMIAKATVNIEKTGPAAGSTEAQIITSMKSLTGKLRQMNSTLSMIIEQSMVKERIPLLAEFKEGVSYKEGIYSDALTAFITQLKALESRLTKAVPSA